MHRKTDQIELTGQNVHNSIWLSFNQSIRHAFNYHFTGLIEVIVFEHWDHQN